MRTNKPRPDRATAARGDGAALRGAETRQSTHRAVASVIGAGPLHPTVLGRDLVSTPRHATGVQVQVVRNDTHTTTQRLIAPVTD